MVFKNAFKKLKRREFLKSLMNSHAANNEERIIQMIQNHFSNIRQKQKQNHDLTSLTDEIRFILTFVNDSVMYPVPLLKKMGIIIIKQKLLPLPPLPPFIKVPPNYIPQVQPQIHLNNQTPQEKQLKQILEPVQPISSRQEKHQSNKKLIAINYLLLQNQVNIPRNRAISSLHREGWHDYTEEQFTKMDLLSPLIGAVSVKDWSLLYYPEDTNLSRYITENPRIIASQESLQQVNPNESDNNQNNPSLLAEYQFPLVSIQYERIFKSYDLVSFPPNNETPKLSIAKADSFDLNMSDSNIK